MSIRVSTDLIYSQGLDLILARQKAATDTQLQLSSGRRVNSAADDPSGMASVLRIRGQLERLSGYASNIETATARRTHEESVLDGATAVLQRVRELALTANNTPIGATERDHLATELDHRLAELSAIANAQDASGEYVFAGTQFNTRPFALTGGQPAVTYSGDQAVREVGIADGRRLAMNDSGYRVFQAIRNGNGTFASSAAATNTGAGVISPGTVVDAAAYDAQSYTVQASALTVPTTGALNFNDDNGNDTLVYELRINGVLVSSLGEGSSVTIGDLATAINAQSGASGVRAVASGTDLHLVNTTPGGNEITLTETLSGSSDNGDSVDGLFGLSLSGIAPTNDTTYASVADGYVVEDGAGTLVAGGAFTSGAPIQFAGVQVDITGVPELGDTFDVDPSAHQDVFTTVARLRDALAVEGAQLGNRINEALSDIDQSMSNLEGVRAEIGSRLNRLEMQERVNGSVELLISEQLSSIEDLDMVRAATRLSEQLTVLEAAQQSFIRIQSISLFDLLR